MLAIMPFFLSSAYVFAQSKQIRFFYINKEESSTSNPIFRRLYGGLRNRKKLYRAATISVGTITYILN
jgi:hypothetical protein